MAKREQAETSPNVGATGPAVPPRGGDGPPPEDAGPAAEGAPVNQGAPGAGPSGEGAYRPGGGPRDGDSFAHRPELFVGAAFLGGFAAAQILKRFRK